jgi:hypothetical protein
MWKDPIVEETHALRDAYAKSFNYDMQALRQDILKKQALHPERLVSYPPRKPVIPVAQPIAAPDVAPPSSMPA